MLRAHVRGISITQSKATAFLLGYIDVYGDFLV